MSNGGTFVGSYTSEFGLLTEASAVSAMHMMANGFPGGGKTDMMESAAEQMFDDRWAIWELDPSSSPEDINGRPDPELWGRTGEYKIVVDGTAFDPNLRCLIFDEFSRPMDAVRYATIRALTRMSKEARAVMRAEGDVHLPVVWATNNFWPKTEGNVAVIDRFPLIMWLPDERLDPHAVVTQHMKSIGGLLRLDYSFPTAQTIETVRGWKPSDAATKAVDDMIAVIVDECDRIKPEAQYHFIPRPRRFRQWSTLLFRMSALRYGSPDFTSIHNDAIRVIAYAWPTADEAEAMAWQAVCASLCDPMQGAIDNLFAKAREEMRNVGGSPEQKSRALGMALATGQDTLMKFARDRGLVDASGNITDKRVSDAIIQLTRDMATFTQGG